METTAKKLPEVKNLRQIKATFLGATSTLDNRIKIYEPARFNDRPTQSKTFGYNYEIDDVAEQAFQILQNNGFNVVCRANERDNFLFLCDNWVKDFKEVKDLK